MMLVDDLISVLDVLGIDQAANADFGGTSLSDKMRVAVEAWLVPRLEQYGYTPARHRTRRPPTTAWGYTGSAYTELTDALPDRASTLDLTTVFAADGDALLVSLDQPFRGLFVGLGPTSVNANSLALAVEYWNGQWTTPSSIVNTATLSGAPFGKSGRIVWSMPTDWIERSVQGGAYRYYVRLAVTGGALTAGTVLEQLVPITRSRLTHAAALETLALVYGEGAGGSRGEWEKKAEAANKAAMDHLQLVLPQVIDEFDRDQDGVTELEDQLVEPVPTAWTWERG